MPKIMKLCLHLLTFCRENCGLFSAHGVQAYESFNPSTLQCCLFSLTETWAWFMMIMLMLLRECPRTKGITVVIVFHNSRNLMNLMWPSLRLNWTIQKLVIIASYFWYYIVCQISIQSMNLMWHVTFCGQENQLVDLRILKKYLCLTVQCQLCYFIIIIL